MKVKVVQVGKTIRTVTIDDEATVATAIRAAEFSADGYQITVNGSSASNSTPLRDGDTVTLAAKAKGN